MAPATGRAWLATAGLIFGSVLGWHHAPVALGASLLVAAGSLASARRRPHVRLVALFAGCVALGVLGVHARGEPRGALADMSHSVPRCRGAGAVRESLGGLGSLVDLSAASCDGFAPVTVPGTAYVVEDPGPPGTRFEGTFRLVPLSWRNEFDVARARIGATAGLDPLDLSYTPPTSIPLRFAEGARTTLRRVTEPWGAGGALVLGLTIGDTDGMGQGTVEYFRRAGLSHLVAVSGSNLAIVLGAVAFSMRALGHRIRVAGAAIAIGLFVLVVGPQPSVLRAAAMGAVGLAAVGWGRRTEPLLALALGTFIVVAWRPALVYSAGLQLSAAATAGIVLWTGPVGERFRWLPALLRLALAATLSAQFAVAPLLIGTFGEFSLMAPLANVLAFPPVAPATVLGVAAGLVGAVYPAAGTFLARLASSFAGWILVVGERLGAVSWASIALPRGAGLVAAVPVLAAVWRTLRTADRAPEGGVTSSDTRIP